jgi:hypothetical protein
MTSNCAATFGVELMSCTLAPGNEFICWSLYFPHCDIRSEFEVLNSLFGGDKPLCIGLMQISAIFGGLLHFLIIISRWIPVKSYGLNLHWRSPLRRFKSC